MLSFGWVRAFESGGLGCCFFVRLSNFFDRKLLLELHLNVFEMCKYITYNITRVNIMNQKYPNEPCFGQFFNALN